MYIKDDLNFKIKTLKVTRQDQIKERPKNSMRFTDFLNSSF